MVVTSRGGVGCCWVNPLIRLTDYVFCPLGAASLSYILSEAIAYNNSISIR